MVGTEREMRDALQALTARYTDLTAVKGKLEKQIVGLPDSIVTLYEVAKRKPGGYPARLNFALAMWFGDSISTRRVCGLPR
jgi:hypothetical protein